MDKQDAGLRTEFRAKHLDCQVPPGQVAWHMRLPVHCCVLQELFFSIDWQESFAGPESRLPVERFRFRRYVRTPEFSDRDVPTPRFKE